jgi:uncharacterized protein
MGMGMDFPTRQVRCPACGGPSLYGPANTYRPFCGERCRQIDLGDWASEKFSLAEGSPDRSPDFDQH